jgi:hypothetical protein
MSPIAENLSRNQTQLRFQAYLGLQDLTKLSPPTSIADSLRIAKAALDRLQRSGREYAKASAPTSPNSRISGNRKPTQTKLVWLKDRNKCNQFVGDVLTDSGFAMPLNKMKDGTFHYASAESLTTKTAQFREISIKQARVGDLAVFDWAKEGENGAHVQVITKIDLNRNKLELTGAGKLGAQTSDYSTLLSHGQLNQSWMEKNNAEVYLLRPIEKL